MYKHILLAIDHDKDGAQLLNKAYAVAASHGARPSLLHVVDFIPSASADPMGLSIDASLPQQLGPNARRGLDTPLPHHPALPPMDQSPSGPGPPRDQWFDRQGAPGRFDPQIRGFRT